MKNKPLCHEGIQAEETHSFIQFVTHLHKQWFRPVFVVNFDIHILAL